MGYDNSYLPLNLHGVKCMSFGYMLLLFFDSLDIWRILILPISWEDQWLCRLWNKHILLSTPRHPLVGYQYTLGRPRLPRSRYASWYVSILLFIAIGTGDIQLSLCQDLSISSSVTISTPQSLSLIDTYKGIRMFTKMKVPVDMYVENMAYFKCNHNEIYYPFGILITPSLYDH